MTSITIQALNKKLLIAILGISKSTLNRRMKYLKPEILLINPLYNENSQILRQDIFILICKDYGLSNEQIAERFINHFPNYNLVNIEKIRGMYGL